MHDQIVVSVGPYMFHSDPTVGARVSARWRVRGSPPTSAVSLGRLVHPPSTNIFHIVCVAWSMVAPDVRTSGINSRGSRDASSLAITMVAPLERGRKISSPAMSKDGVVIDNTMSDDAIPGAEAIELRKLTTLPWLTTTPFGC